MPKRFLMLIGTLLFVGAVIFGWFTLHERNFRKTPAAQPANQAANTSQQTVVPVFNKTKYSTTSPESIWVVANKQHPLNPLTYAPADLTDAGNSQQMRKEAADALAGLIAGAKAVSLFIQPLSGYRSYATQQSVYNKEVATYGQAVADSESAKPGYSEHQTGWAIDVGGGGCGIEDCFGNTAEGKWLAAHAFEYGFIVRYTADKQTITGYRAEPWHIRYIGTELSNEMHRQNITTLEEFFGL